MKTYLILATVLCLPGVLLVKTPPDSKIDYSGEFHEIRRYDAPEATQAVAVCPTHFFAIANSRIGKYDRQSGKRVALWEADEDRPLTHLNSGIVREGKLYCAHSNYPSSPEASSVEVWDLDLKHIDSHSLGVYEGSLTWIEPSDDGWWAVFAHYSRNVGKVPLAKSHRWTTLVKFDREWRRTAGWVFPESVLDRFAPNSCSGGGWGPDGFLYCTGHDHAEVYRMSLPRAGSILRLEETWKVPITGQGVAWDLQHRMLFGINRSRRQVTVSRLPKPNSDAD